MWPDLTSTPTVARAKDTVTSCSPWAIHNWATSRSAPTKVLKADILAASRTGDQQFAASSKYLPAAHASHTAAALARYTAQIEASASVVRRFFASEATVLVWDCRGFNDTLAVDGIAVQTTNGAQLIMRADHATTASAAILVTGAHEEGHYVIFESLTGRGAHRTARYKVAAITAMVDASTTVPTKLPRVPVSVPC